MASALAVRGAASQLSLPLGKGVAVRRVRASTSYEAASTARRASKWYAPTLGPNAATLYDLTTLRARSRQAIRNDGFAKSIIDTLVYNVVGYGIKPLSLAKDEGVRRAVTDLWNRWIKRSTSDNRLGFYGQQMQAVRCWFEGGECFIVLRPRLPQDNLAVPLQLQVLEPELCPHDYSSIARNGNAIRAGVEFDGIGNRAAYYFYRQRPGDLQDWTSEMVRTSVAGLGFERVLHLFDQQRAGQIRGVPILAQALIKLYELDKFGDAVLLRQQLGNLYTGFVKRMNPGESATEVNAITGLAADDRTAEGRDVVALEPGIVQELGPGEEMQFADPPDPPATYAAFMSQQLRAACASAGTPYEIVTNDWASLNDRIARVVLHEFRRRVQVFQFSIVEHQICEPTWLAWITQGLVSGALPFSAADYEADPSLGAVAWVPQGWPYIHPVQDVQAAKEAIRCGLDSRSSVVSTQGEDATAIDAQQAADNARADALGLRYDSDGRQAKAAPPAAPSGGGGGPDNPQPDNPEAPADGTEDEPGGGNA